MTNSILFPLVAAVAVFGLPSPSLAQAAPTVRVGIADLNLLSPTDKVVLTRRIKAAVDKVCGDRDIPRNLETFAARSKCRAAAHTNADHQIAVLTDRLRVRLAMQGKPAAADAVIASR